MNCKTIQPLLSEYIDNALSARDTWEVDRHLGGCNSCVQAVNELRKTVSLMAEAPRFDVSANFMEKLQARIATLEPEPSRAAWFATLRQMFRPRVRPAWGAGLAACALALIFFVSRPSEITGVEPPLQASPISIVQTSQNQNVALAASNPLGDPAAAALVASNVSESGEPATAVE